MINSPYAERPEGSLEKPCFPNQTFGTVLTSAIKFVTTSLYDGKTGPVCQVCHFAVL
jgi:hypothetical protein